MIWKRLFIYEYTTTCESTCTCIYLGITKVIDGSWYECLGELGAPGSHRGGQGTNDTQGGHDVVLVGVGKTSLESPRELT